MRKLTFEKILAAYLSIAALLALIFPRHWAIEHHILLDSKLIPFASWLSMTPDAMPFLTTYFLVLSLLLPVVVVLLACHPQDHGQFTYRIPTLGRCTGATLISIVIAVAIVGVMYGDYRLDGTEVGRGGVLMYAAAVSRLGLVIVGPLLMGTTAIAFYLILVKLPRMWLGMSTGKFG